MPRKRPRPELEKTAPGADLAREVAELRGMFGALVSELRAQKRTPKKPGAKSRNQARAIANAGLRSADLESARKRAKGQRQMTYATGSIETRTRKDGSEAHRVKIGGETIGTFPNRELANRAKAAELLIRTEAPSLIGTSFRTYADRYVAKCGLPIKQRKNLEAIWTNTVGKASWVDGPIDKVTPLELRDWLHKELPKVKAKRSIVKDGKRTSVETDTCISHQTIKHCRNFARSIFKEAKLEGLITQNPLDDLDLPKRKDTKEKWSWLRPVEIEAILGLDLTLEQRTAISVAIFQGLRVGEIAGLRWQNIRHLYSDDPELLVCFSYDVPTTKNGELRTVQIMPRALEALRAWHASKGKPDTGLVFPSPVEGSLKRPEVCYNRSHRWGWDASYRLVDGKRTRIPTIPERAGIARNVRWHDTRHTCASNLVSGNWGEAWPLEAVRDFLGHSDISVTQRYAHLCPERLAKKVKATKQGGPEGGAQGSGGALAGVQSSGPQTVAQAAPQAPETQGTLAQDLPTPNFTIHSNPSESLARPAGLEPTTVSLEEPEFGRDSDSLQGRGQDLGKCSPSSPYGLGGKAPQDGTENDPGIIPIATLIPGVGRAAHMRATAQVLEALAAPGVDPEAVLASVLAAMGLGVGKLGHG